MICEDNHADYEPCEEDVSRYDYLERDFTLAEIISDIWYLKYLFCCFRNLSCMKYRR